MLEYEKYKLKNGITVLLAPLANTMIANIEIYVKIGSRYERAANNGITHLIEHMLFKGTKKRPRGIDISMEAENMGAHMNAGTAKSFCRLYANSLSEYFEKCMDMLSDMLCNSQFREENIALERGSIMEEIKHYRDIPSYRVGEMYDRLLFKDNPLSLPIGGSEESLAGMKRKNLFDFVKKHFTAKNIIISASGGIEPGKTRELIENYFGGVKPGVKNRYRTLSVSQSRSAMISELKKTEQTQIWIGARSFEYGHPDFFALGIMNILLGGSPSSRLFKALRENTGLVYSVQSANMSGRDYGHLLITAGCAHAKSGAVVKIILSELRKLREKNVTASELKRVKNAVRSSLYMSLDSSAGIAHYLVSEETAKGKIMSPEEKLSLIDRVTASDIRRVSGRIFKNSRMNLAMIGPVPEQEIKPLFKL
ncbi:MAG: pitrilysin family protein [Elusimicrobiota bacterium]|nr:pitrilysin family protein [Elusimicrobiota bacterium]